MLTDAAGKQIPKGPTDVVVDKEAVKRGRDPEVVNGVSCMNCHWSGMLNKTDQIRQHVLSQPASYPAEVVEFVTAVYVEKEELAARLKEDRERFEAAVKKCGLPSLTKSEPVATLAFQFDEPLDLESAAAEVGVPPARLTAALAAHAALGRELGSLSQGQGVPRDTFVQQFAALTTALQTGKYIAPLPPRNAYEAGEERSDNSLGLKLVWCPPGKFKMGSPASEEHREVDEKQVPVELTQGFWMGMQEVTQAEFAKIMETAPWKRKQFVREGADMAANYISYDDAVAFCLKLTQSERQAGRLGPQQEYRLPSEAQWEYACRAGTTTAYSFPSGSTDARLGEHAWYDKNTYDVNRKYAHPAGLKIPNDFGLLDMHGNVCEWCRDGYSKQLPGGTNPEAAFDGKTRVMRGGSWDRASRFSRSAGRLGFPPDLQSYAVGFRVSRTP
ncbi:MAG: formylglycine-generating enzyme family protein [Pirellulaceae bacterium]|nr:formylglycine-generating enzyme family protein [Pirellulaceae bacterium]